MTINSSSSSSPLSSSLSSVTCEEEELNFDSESLSFREFLHKYQHHRDKLSTSNSNSNSTKRCPPPSIYFGGCCFGAGFYIGVIKAMVDKWGPDFYKDVVLGGGSAGTIIAIGLALGKSPEYMDNLYKYVAENSYKKGPVYYASHYMEKAMREMLKDDDDAYKKIEGRMCIGTTAFYDKHRWHISWESNEDLINCVKGSYHVPFYCKRNPKIKGSYVVDGAYGFGGLDLMHGDDTLYVGIDPHAEITRHFTYPEMFYPPVGKDYIDMVDSGYAAMIEWDGNMTKKVGGRVANYTALKVLWTLKLFEIGVFKVIDFYYYIITVFLFAILFQYLMH